MNRRDGIRDATSSLLVVDDDPAVTEWLRDELSDCGFVVATATSGEDALEALRSRTFDLVISDVEMPRMRGTELMAALRRTRPGQQLLLMSAFGSIELAVESVRAGATDFLAKPFSSDALVHAVRRALRERSAVREPVRQAARPPEPATQELVARSDAMQRVLALAKKAAASPAPLIITGESGVGKTALARFVHAHAVRTAGPFVELNCAALPAHLVEAELFGVRRGAFTDAKETRAGLYEQADGGTLFLDELGEMAPEVQPKLLRAIESGRIRAVGALHEKQVSVRIIAATNASLEEAVRDRRFRADLYHRLNVLRIEIPPLRMRSADIEALVEKLLAQAAQRTGRQGVRIEAELLSALTRQPWPGNVRQLGNAIERAVTLSERDVLGEEDFDLWTNDPGPLLDEALEQTMTVEQLSTEYLKRVLARTRGNKTLAAQILGLDRRTVYRKVSELGLDERGD